MFEEWNKDIKAALYERMSSPLYSSFIASWLVCNWKILYVTFVLDNKDLPSALDGKILYKLNKLQYIEKYLLVDINKLLFYPLLSALAFVTILPAISILVFALFELFKKWRKGIRLYFLGETPIPGSRLVELTNQFEEERKEWSIIFSEKDNWEQTKNSYIGSITAKDKLLDEKQKEIDLLISQKVPRDIRDKFLRIFYGRWTNTWQDEGQEKSESEEFEIKYNGNEILYILYRHKNEVYQYAQEAFRIINIRFTDSQLSFEKMRPNGSQKFEVIFKFDTNSFPISLQGKENNTITVNYEKQSINYRNYQSLANLIIGKWRVKSQIDIKQRTSLNNTDITFILEIKEGNKWYEDNVYKFNIDMVEYDGINLKFRKIDITNNSKMHFNVLTKDMINNTKFFEYKGKEYYSSGEIFDIEYNQIRQDLSSSS